MKTPNYHDFYQVALVPIGMNDLKVLKESDSCSGRNYTHWLIAVEGVQLPDPKIYFHWRVTIYPADCEGDFNWQRPYFVSTASESMDIAIKLASNLVSSSKNDSLIFSTKLEKIS
ncbi:hypothetical protein [Neobacillus dielmonensis]|uniref:hypothetical protein n=1 Tax=Neobacillus dielmonensis TaxID=1347369 RepID=UPI0005A6F381|nr:hypothetical protein [Neobacillus dielmonensis]